jgi:hypothetical protein
MGLCSPILYTRMKTILASILLCTLAASTNAQWFARAENLLGNWSVAAANTGAVFNKDNAAGAYWNKKEMIFGGGLWIGGILQSNDSISTMTYNPNSGASQFVPGSFLAEGALLDSLTNKYKPYLSSKLSSDDWPVRVVGGVPTYIDDPTMRTAAGPPSFIGEEDIFFVYKNTDPAHWLDHTAADKTMPLVEIRTQMGFWSKGAAKDIVIVRNQIVNVSTTTLHFPAIGLAMDADVFCPGGGATNYMQGFLSPEVEGCYFRGYDGKTLAPMLGIYLVKSPTNSQGVEAGITTLRRWSLANDPPNAAKRYTFMTSQQLDTSINAKSADIRAMLASASDKPFAPGDMISFDYALYGYQPSASNTGSTEVIDMGKTITSLYKQGLISLLDVKAKPQQPAGITITPNPATDDIVISLGDASIHHLEIFDMLGNKVASDDYVDDRNSVRLSVQHLAQGVYYIKTEGQIGKFIKL